MEDETLLQLNDLVTITPAGGDWISRSQTLHKSSISGRVGIVLDIYDWETPRGKEILAGRENTARWTSLKSEDFKYVILVLFPELEYEG